MSDLSKPSDIVLGVPPLCGTMQRAEVEFAAALIVHTCQTLGDRWQPITLEQLSNVLADASRGAVEPIVSLLRNPFFRPDFHLLARSSYARWCGEEGQSPIELTEAGITALERWRRRGPE